MKWTPKTGQPIKLQSGSPGKGKAMVQKRKTYSAEFNTDQGAQFTARPWTSRLEAAGVAVSMDGKGRCLDNGRWIVWADGQERQRLRRLRRYEVKNRGREAPEELRSPKRRPEEK